MSAKPTNEILLTKNYINSVKNSTFKRISLVLSGLGKNLITITPKCHYKSYYLICQYVLFGYDLDNVGTFFIF
jgi:hypothetical protein